ncbi:MAG: hypothetical protein L0241_18005, partial [Planctomycetia bacterium]|nr:hypothetical protein [Planctomycetia bacterium]
MSTGRLPFTGESAFDMMAAVVAHQPTSPLELAPELPPALSALIQRLLAKDPTARWQSAESVAEELEAIERSLTALPVRAIPLPPALDTPAVPDPWAEIDTTHADAVVHSTPALASAPRSRGSGSPPKWFWPAVAACGVIALIGLVLLAVQALKPKDKQDVVDDTKQQPPAPKKNDPPKPVNDPDHRVAEWVIRNGGAVDVLVGQVRHNDIHKLDQLPTESFRVVSIIVTGQPTVEDKALDSFRDLQGLEKLELHFQPVTDAGLARFLASPAAAGLRELSLQVEIGDSALVSLPKLTRLTAVALRSTKLTDKTVERLRNLPLVNVDLSRTAITKSGFVPLVGKKLVILNLNYCAGVDDEGLKHLKGMTTLNFVSLERSGVGNDGLSYLIANTQLAELNLTNTKVTDGGLDHTIRFPKMITLVLNDLPITNDGLAKLKALPELKSLSLERTKVTDDGLVHAAGMKLTELDLQDLPITDKGLKQLESATTLRKLIVANTKVTEPGAKKLAAKLTQCEIIWNDRKVIKADDSDRTIAEWLLMRENSKVIIRLPDTETCDITKLADLPAGPFKIEGIQINTPFTDADLKRLEPLTQLRTLHLFDRHSLTTDGLRALLVHKERLVELCLSAGPVTNDGVKILVELTELEELDLDGTQVTNDGLKPLLGLKKLQRLYLSDTGISDDAIPTLSEMKTLTGVFLNRTKVTEAGAKKLAAALPKCRIEWGDEQVIEPKKDEPPVKPSSG